MRKQSKVLLCSYGAAAAFVAAGLVFTSAAGTEGYRRSQDNEYRRAMAQLVSSMDDANEALEKGKYTEGAGMSGKVSAQLMAAVQSASASLGILPLDTYALEELAGFLSQVEEYATVKGSLACVGEGFDQADRETFDRLQEVTARLVPVLSEMYLHLNEGGLTVRGRMEENGLVTDAADTYLEDEILALLEDFPETPAMHYAGKLSDDYDDSHAAVEGLAELSEAQALDVAKKLTGSEELHTEAVSQGELPGYYFGGEIDGNAVTVAVTRQGGFPELYLREYSAGETVLSEAEGKQLADEFLQKAGYHSMQEESSVVEGGLLKLTYVYADADASYLSDAVKVTVALDSGEIVAMDASSYLKNHGREKNKSETVLPAEEAIAVAVPEGLTVTEQELTWFTGKTGTTTLCWRFVCKDADGESCVIYAECSTGRQVEIQTADGNVSDM